MINSKEIVDEKELLKLAQKGDEVAMETLLGNYKATVTLISRKFYLIGGDRDDLIQEGMIGLYKAIISYTDGRGTTFESYASKLIEREMVNAIRKAGTQKSSMLNDSVDMDISIVEGGTNTEQEFLTQEKMSEIYREIDKQLSKMEKVVVKQYLLGYNYIDIAEQLGKTPKSVDNALSRIKNKLKYLKDRL